tara:strand:- start:890 stop:1255 length:366 start_codon:yes stop_codon:yes gene_type:complete
MKKMNYLLIFTLVTTTVFMSSCSDDELCHECHLALEMADGSEMMWHIENSAGGEEFCGEELHDVEVAYTAADTLTCEAGDHKLAPGVYTHGDTSGVSAIAGAAEGAAWEIHCEDHGEHDDH